MKIAYLDTIAGIAGDMTMAALVSAGLPFDELRDELRKLNVDGFELIAHHVRRSAIDAVHIDVVITHATALSTATSRDIQAIIERSGLSAEVKDRATSIFTVLGAGRSEGAQHDASSRSTSTKWEPWTRSWISSGRASAWSSSGSKPSIPRPSGSGSGGIIKTQHGMMPTPAPATTGDPAGLSGRSDRPSRDELTTPTGAAIIKALSARRPDRRTPSRIHAVGYGAGTKEFEGLPNLLRVVIGELAAERRPRRAS